MRENETVYPLNCLTKGFGPTNPSMSKHRAALTSLLCLKMPLLFALLQRLLGAYLPTLSGNSRVC
jgi:hypothetical protein